MSGACKSGSFGGWIGEGDVLLGDGVGGGLGGRRLGILGRVVGRRLQIVVL